MQPKVSILLPHYQTPKLTLLCLELLRRRTRRRDYEVIVIDNGSQDESGEVLRQLSWIRVLERQPEPGELPAQAHGRALNLGVEHSNSPYILTMHTDTMVLHAKWLDYLLGKMDSAGPSCGIVGSWKMESPGNWQKLGKWIEDLYRNWWKSKGESRKYVRTHCALYRRQVLGAHRSMFEPSIGFSAGEELHEAAQEAGFACKFLSPEDLGSYVRHLNHATMALNKHFGTTDPYMHRTRRRAIRRIEEFFEAIRADELLAEFSFAS